jgi:hypothetical protein
VQKTKPQFGDAPSNEQLLDFQRAFAEFSGGRDCVKAVDVRRLFESVGVMLSAAQVREMLKEIAPDEVSPNPHYSELLHMYCKCMGAAVGSLDRMRPSKAQPSNGKLDVTDVLLVDEAREYCIAAGVLEGELEDLLHANASDGLVSLIGLDRALKEMDKAGRLNGPCLSAFDLGAELGVKVPADTSGKSGSAATKASSQKIGSAPSLDAAVNASSLEASPMLDLGQPATIQAPVAADAVEEDDLASIKHQLEEAKAALASKQELHRNEVEHYKAELQKYRGELPQAS